MIFAPRPFSCRWWILPMRACPVVTMVSSLSKGAITILPRACSPGGRKRRDRYFSRVALPDPGCFGFVVTASSRPLSSVSRTSEANIVVSITIAVVPSDAGAVARAPLQDSPTWSPRKRSGRSEQAARHARSMGSCEPVPSADGSVQLASEPLEAHAADADLHKHLNGSVRHNGMLPEPCAPPAASCSDILPHPRQQEPMPLGSAFLFTRTWRCVCVNIMT